MAEIIAPFPSFNPLASLSDKLFVFLFEQRERKRVNRLSVGFIFRPSNRTIKPNIANKVQTHFAPLVNVPS